MPLGNRWMFCVKVNLIYQIYNFAVRRLAMGYLGRNSTADL